MLNKDNLGESQMINTSSLKLIFPAVEIISIKGKLLVTFTVQSHCLIRISISTLITTVIINLMNL